MIDPTSGSGIYVPRALRPALEPAESQGTPSTAQSAREIQTRLTDLRRALDRLQRLGGISSSPPAASGQAAATQSSSGIGLVVENSYTTLRSTEEVNADPYSYGPRGPSFGGASTTEPTIGGTYDGDQGNDTLTFKAKDNGPIGGGGNLKIEVRDGNDDKIDELNFQDLAADTPLTLSNGLTLSLSAGTLVKNETFTVDVSTSVGAVVDPTKSFDATRNDDPGFEAAFSVIGGSFEVNGVGINVLANDSIDSVLARITASAAGVTASFDATTESVLLTQKTAGPASTIVLANDSSGFLDATKLSSAVAVIPEFSGVSSSEEINAVPTSYTPFEPIVSGPLTTAQPVVSGTYSGAQGTDTLTFKFKNNETVAADKDIKVEVRDGNDDKIDELNFRNLAPGTVLTLSNGIGLALSAGFVKKDETFTLDVSDLIPSSVNPDGPFDQTGDDRPNFEAGLAVSAGSFSVNGTLINVAADDTIRTVVDRITALVPDVSASFDAGAEKVRISRDTAGSFLDVSITGDTSGFVAAAKLTGGSSPGGQGADADRIISTVPALSGISSGFFEINGVSISVDVGADTLSDVIDRINASGAGASATLDSDALRIESAVVGNPLALADGTSGFFSALKVVPGSYGSESSTSGGNLAVGQRNRLRRELDEVRRALDAVFSRSARGDDGGILDEVRKGLRASIAGLFPGRNANSRDFRSGLGIDFDFGDFSRGVFSLNNRRFDRALGRNVDELNKFLFLERSGGQRQGLVASLLGQTTLLQEALAEAVGASGTRGVLLDLEV